MLTDKHEELAARCEAAEGPSRELDCEIMDALSLWPQRWTRYTDGAPLGDGPVYYLHPTGRPEWRVADKFTVSIDAAVTLVPEGLVWRVQTDFGLPGRARLWGSVLPGQIADRGWKADGSTPALAICAAALRAKGQADAN